MKSFIFKSIFFVSPFFLLAIINWFFYTNQSSDLKRIGYIYSFDKIFNLLKFKQDNLTLISKCININEYDFIKQKDWNSRARNKKIILVLGDSFSEVHSSSYTNYLAKNDSLLIINLDYKHKESTSINYLAGLINGNYFDSIKIHCVIIESVERHIVDGFENLDTLFRIKNINKKNNINNDSEGIKSDLADISFFSNSLYLIPYINLMYNFQAKPYGSQTYKKESILNLFSNGSNYILFYDKDLINVPRNKDSIRLNKVNENLNWLNNKLNSKGVDFIFFPAPDKYDVYYDFIKFNNNLSKPLFFDVFKKFNKTYKYFDTKVVIQNLMFNNLDVYEYYDSHWSNNTSKFLAVSLVNIIKK